MSAAQARNELMCAGSIHPRRECIIICLSGLLCSHLTCPPPTTRSCLDPRDYSLPLLALPSRLAFRCQLWPVTWSLHFPTKTPFCPLSPFLHGLLPGVFGVFKCAFRAHGKLTALDPDFNICCQEVNKSPFACEYTGIYDEAHASSATSSDPASSVNAVKGLRDWRRSWCRLRGMMKLTRAPSRLVALLMLAMVFLAVYYAGLASHATGWSNQPTRRDDDRIILENFQQEFVQCVREKGMGLDARPVNDCKVKLVFTDTSAAIWRDPKTGELEGLVYEFDLCRMISLWEQVRNSTTILTKEYIDGLPNGWRDYAWKRINKGHSKMCSNTTLCKEKLALVLPDTPPFVPRQYGRCAVVGNSGDLLQDLFGAEIDSYDAVIRMNGAPVENYTHYVGEKTTFRILNRGSAKALDKVAALAASAQEILIIKTTIHDIMSRMIREVPIRNPVYLMVGAPLGISAKGTGIKAIEFALSVCEQVDIYGFTVDRGYLEWTRYFSDARKGHSPLQGRAYYQTMECLGLIRVHSPRRRVRSSTRHVKLSSIVHNAAAHLGTPNKRECTGTAIGGPLGACTLSIQGAKLLLNTSKSSQEHQTAVNAVRQYARDQASPGGILCIGQVRL